MAHYKDNKIHVAGLILGQCQEAMRHKLEEFRDWNVIKRNPIQLMRAIKVQSFKYCENEYSAETVHRALNNFMMLR